jgi:hypothetical protein
MTMTLIFLKGTTSWLVLALYGDYEYYGGMSEHFISYDSATRHYDDGVVLSPLSGN